MIRRQPLPSRVLRTVDPVVAVAAKRDQVVNVIPQLGESRPRVDVMGVQRFRRGLRCRTFAAGVSIPLVDRAQNRLPFGGGVDTLPLWRAAIDVARVQRASATGHSVSGASQPRLRNARSLGDFGAGFLRVASPKPMRDVVRGGPGVVLAMEVMPTWSSGDSEVFELRVDALRITPDKSANVVGGQAFHDVLLAQPFGVKVRGFSHTDILIHSRGF